MALILVTGASSGIGAATARRYAARGDTIVLVARRREQLGEVAEAVRGAGGVPIVEAVDAGDGEAVVALAGRVIEAHGAPDVVINCAGAGAWRFIEDTPPGELDGMMAAPFRAAFHVCHAFLPAMMRARRGVVVHVNSPACTMPWPGSTGYTAARWALRGLHEALSQDLPGTGVASTHVILGEVSSAYFDANPDSHEGIPRIAALIPVLTPEYAAKVVVRAADRRRREVIAPFVLRTFVWQRWLVPGLIRWLVRVTGRRRSPARG